MTRYCFRVLPILRPSSRFFMYVAALCARPLTRNFPFAVQSPSVLALWTSPREPISANHSLKQPEQRKHSNGLVYLSVDRSDREGMCCLVLTLLGPMKSTTKQAMAKTFQDWSLTGLVHGAKNIGVVPFLFLSGFHESERCVSITDAQSSS